MTTKKKPTTSSGAKRPPAKKAGGASPPRGKARSRTRNQPRDWANLHAEADASSRAVLRETGFDFDEHYVTALQLAIEGRDLSLLLEMLRERRLVPPSLLPILADAIETIKHGRGQDDTRGAGRKLTHGDDAAVRVIYDDACGRMPSSRQARLFVAGLFRVSDDTIKGSLARTSGQ